MAVQIQYKVEGFEELMGQLNSFKEEIGKQKTDRIWRNLVKRSAEPILQAVKAGAPKDTGQLADRIYMKVRRPRRQDKTGKFYAGEEYFARILASPLRNESTRHQILTKRKKKNGDAIWSTVWRGKKPVAISQEFGNARVPATFFMRNGLKRAQRQSIDLMVGLLKIEIAELSRKRNRAASARG